MVIGVSISLLFAPRPQENAQPYPNNDNAQLGWRRDYGGPLMDYDGIGFRVVPIVGLVASAINFFIIAPL